MKMIHFGSWFIILMCTIPACVKGFRVTSMDSLRKKLAQAQYSIVFFYDSSQQNMKNEQIKEKIKDSKTMFESLRKDDYYQDAKLQFISVDVDKSKLRSAQRRYKLEQLPAFVIFLGREPEARVYGYLYREQLEEFIEKHLKTKMDKTIKEAAKRRKKELEQAKIRAYNRPYWYGPYGYSGFYPYWWYGPGWGPYYRRWYWW